MIGTNLNRIFTMLIKAVFAMTGTQTARLHGRESVRGVLVKI